MKHSNLLRLPIFLGMAPILVACGNSGTETAPNKPTVSEPVKAVEKTVAETQTNAPVEAVTAEMTQEAILKRGRIVWFKCRSCHETSVDGPHKVGPNLHGLMGAQAAAQEGFVYSKALKNSEIVWNDETLDAFIEKSATYIKGTKMAFVGIKKESDRQAVIAYIKENTKPVE